MESIVGTWKPYARQASLSPVRPMKENGFATLTIQPDWSGRATRKTLFNDHVEDLFWTIIPDDYSHYGGAFLIAIADVFALSVNVYGDEMEAEVVGCYLPGMEGTTFFFKRA